MINSLIINGITQNNVKRKYFSFYVGEKKVIWREDDY